MTGDPLSLDVNVTSYNRMTVKKTPQTVLVLEGENLVEVDGNTMTVTGTSGDVSFLTGYTDRTLGYTIYTQPVTVCIYDPAATTEAIEIETPSTSPVETSESTETSSEVVTDTPDKTESGCHSTIGGIALMIPAATMAWGIRKKKDN
jgi:hypothetical protein